MRKKIYLGIIIVAGIAAFVIARSGAIAERRGNPESVHEPWIATSSSLRYDSSQRRDAGMQTLPNPPLSGREPARILPPDKGDRGGLASLTIASTTYLLPLSENETLYDAMKTLAVSNPAFTFDGHEYAGMGFFVDSVNGVKNENGRYWMLYLNHSLAEKGVSQTILHSGDSVEWRYERSL